MPSSEVILGGLTRIANEAFGLAIAWHGVIALVAVALGLGWRPSGRSAGVLSSIPVASAAVLAFAYGNPFNGSLLAVVSLVLGATSLRGSVQPVRRASSARLTVGLGMILFAVFYPHFLEGRSTIAYLYGAPTGLVPCPTLSLGVGVALIGVGATSRAGALTLSGAGLFYGAVGVLHLGVTLDVVLFMGALWLLLVTALGQPLQARLVRRGPSLLTR